MPVSWEEVRAQFRDACHKNAVLRTAYDTGAYLLESTAFY